ncbi:MAG: NAD(P)-binding protein [Geminicoccaceae bacterium]
MVDEPIAIVGAGMAGAACARALADDGHDVVLMDKGRAVGGRMAQRHEGGYAFDHGAQYITTREPDFVAAMGAWSAAGAAAVWPGVHAQDGAPVWVGTPTMRAPVEKLLDGLSVTSDRRIAALAGRSGEWILHDDQGDRYGPFATIVLAMPAPQAAELLAGTPLRDALNGVRIEPCWSALAAFDGPLDADWSAVRPAKGPLVWVARNRTKPGRPAAETVTMHAGPHWSIEALERPADEVAADLLSAFASLTGIQAVPVFMTAQRWRYALVTTPLGQKSLWDRDLGIGVCGDWCIGPRIESAWISGRALAKAITA